MATESKTITVGNGVSGFAWGYDFGPPIGSPYGSINVAASQAFGGANVRAVSWLTNNSGTLSINLVGDARGSGFTQAVVNGTTFTLASADYIAYLSSNYYGPFTSYQWHSVSNPITTTVGATNSVVFTYSTVYGARVWDASNNLIMNTTDTLGFIKSYFTGSLTNLQTKNVTVPTKTSGDVLMDLSSSNFVEMNWTTNTNVAVYNRLNGSSNYSFIIVNQGF
jgi:hypothetical protein